MTYARRTICCFHLLLTLCGFYLLFTLCGFHLLIIFTIFLPRSFHNRSRGKKTCDVKLGRMKLGNLFLEKDE
jgi:hypothetical protein